MRIRSAFVIPNPKKRIAVELKRGVEDFLRRHGVELKKGGDILITIGGDGTLLYNKDRYTQPIFGIGNEKSFICQSNFKNWRKVLSAVLRSSRVEWRSMLRCSIAGRIYENALNEICIRSRDHRVIDISLSLLGKNRKFRADGVLFSTPTGSTAYAYSAGAPQLTPLARKYEIVPIVPYRREFKPMVVPDMTECEMSVTAGNADLVIDGQFIHGVKLNSKIKVFKSERKLGLLRSRT
jgi:NAD+ kinase